MDETVPTKPQLLRIAQNEMQRAFASVAQKPMVLHKILQALLKTRLPEDVREDPLGRMAALSDDELATVYTLLLATAVLCAWTVHVEGDQNRRDELLARICLLLNHLLGQTDENIVNHILERDAHARAYLIQQGYPNR